MSQLSQGSISDTKCISTSRKEIDMKKVANNQKALTDDIYYVSAADVADKLIERMRRGFDPLLLGSSPLALISAGPWLRARSVGKLD